MLLRYQGHSCFPQGLYLPGESYTRVQREKFYRNTNKRNPTNPTDATLRPHLTLLPLLTVNTTHPTHSNPTEPYGLNSLNPNPSPTPTVTQLTLLQAPQSLTRTRSAIEEGRGRESTVLEATVDGLGKGRTVEDTGSRVFVSCAC